MSGVRSKPKAGSGKYLAWYVDANGKIRHFVGTRSKSETLRIATRLEDENRQVRLGYRPAPSSAQKHRTRAFAELATEYQDWGAAQGGRGGRAWSREHKRKTAAALTYWQDALGLMTLADLDGVLPRVERATRDLSAHGLSGKTLQNRVGPLAAFCRWAKQRGYLDADPLAGLASFDITPTRTRRALTDNEIERLLAVAADYRRILYQAALGSGLRAGELRALTPEDLDVERGGIRLRAAMTKNRKDGFQYCAHGLMELLVAFGASGAAKKLYAKHHQANPPSNPLLYVPIGAAKAFDRDLAKAGIPKMAFGGVADFHALRVTYISAVLATGADTKTAMSMARHSSPTLTLNTYGRARNERLEQVAEAVGAAGLENIVPTLSRKAAGAEGLNLSAITIKGSGDAGTVGTGVRFPPPPPFPTAQNHDKSDTDSVQKPNGARACDEAAPNALDNTDTTPEQVKDKFLHDYIVPGLSACADLQTMADAWPSLSEPIKAEILAMVNTTGKQR